MNEFKIDMALLEIPVSGCTCECVQQRLRSLYFQAFSQPHCGNLTDTEHWRGITLYLLENLVDVDLVGLNGLGLAALLLATLGGLGNLLSGLFLCLGSHVESLGAWTRERRESPEVVA